MLGNRGILHDDEGEIVRPHVGKRWILCQLEFKDRQLEIMRPGRYTQLFFLDEAVGLSAGHRPCAECRRAAYNRFRDRYASENAEALAPTKDRLSASALDDHLHRNRLTGRDLRTQFEARLSSLPDGTFFALAGQPEAPILVWKRRSLPWSWTGYGPGLDLAGDLIVRVLTPQPTVAVLAAGYRPGVHPSADR